MFADMGFVIVAVAALIALVVIVRRLGGGKAGQPTYRDGRQIRCHACRKVVYTDASAAQSAAGRLGGQGLYRRAYHERRCGHWHLTSQLPRNN